MPNAVTQPRPTASQRGTSGVYVRPATITGVGLEPAVAALVTLVGIGLTSFGVVSHVPQAVAPGAALAFFGGGWLGNSLARRDVRLLPGTQIVKHEAAEK
jgi:hypothetical protein